MTEIINRENVFQTMSQMTEMLKNGQEADFVTMVRRFNHGFEARKSFIESLPPNIRTATDELDKEFEIAERFRGITVDGFDRDTIRPGNTSPDSLKTKADFIDMIAKKHGVTIDDLARTSVEINDAFFRAINEGLT